MNTSNVNLERTMVFPFYIFLTLLLGFIGVTAILQIRGAGEGGMALLVSALFLIHIGLFWLNVLWADRNANWWLFYYPAQTVMMIGIVSLLQGRSVVGTSFLFSATISIVGEALGVWGNSKRSLIIGTFYVLLLIGTYAKSEKPRI